MIACTNCGTENIEGTVFCDNCGAELPENEFVTIDTNSPTMMDFSFDENSGTHLFHQRTGEEIAIPVKSEVIIGREDPISGIFPDIDTSFLGGEEDGVSRRHAKLTRSGDIFYIEDLNSVNFTYLNKEKLIPHVPQELSDGDELTLGRLKLVMHLN